jgi:hypothetical protein
MVDEKKCRVAHNTGWLFRCSERYRDVLDASQCISEMARLSTCVKASLSAAKSIRVDMPSSVGAETRSKECLSSEQLVALLAAKVCLWDHDRS